MDVLIYTALALIVFLYARILDRVKERLEPDFTWLEVVIGCTLCLAAAAIRHRVTGGDWAAYEAGVWKAFIIGGGVIVAWQIGRAIHRQEELRRRGRTNSETMAEERGSRAPGDD